MNHISCYEKLGKWMSCELNFKAWLQYYTKLSIESEIYVMQLEV